MVKASDVVDLVYNMWLTPAGIYQPSYDILDVQLNAASLSMVTKQRINTVPTSSILEVEYELMFTEAVQKDTPSAGKTTITLNERGVYETDDVVHTAGKKVILNPDYPKQTVLNAVKWISMMLLGWGLYKRNVDTTYEWDPSNFQALPADCLDVVALLVKNDVNNDMWSRREKGRHYVVYPEFVPPKVWTRAGGAAGQQVQLVYYSDFDLSTFSKDTELDTVGIPKELQPHLAMAAAGYVLQGKELPRVVVEEVRRLLSAAGAQVPVGSVLNVGQALMQSFRVDFLEAAKRKQRQLDNPRFEYVG